MTVADAATRLRPGTEEGRRIARTFACALVGTLWFLLIEPARRVVSVEATLAAVALGVLCGATVAVSVGPETLEGANQAAVIVLALIGIVIGTIVISLAVPHAYFGTVIQFVVAFSWAVPITAAFAALRRGS